MPTLSKIVPWSGEATRLTVVTADGTTAVDLACSGSDLAAGIHIGPFDSFTVTLATASGVTLSGACLSGQ